jgi:hypothetical protein
MMMKTNFRKTQMMKVWWTYRTEECCSITASKNLFWVTPAGRDGIRIVRVLLSHKDSPMLKRDCSIAMSKHPVVTSDHFILVEGLESHARAPCSVLGHSSELKEPTYAYLSEHKKKSQTSRQEKESPSKWKHTGTRASKSFELEIRVPYLSCASVLPLKVLPPAAKLARRHHPN